MSANQCLFQKTPIPTSVTVTYLRTRPYTSLCSKLFGTTCFADLITARFARTVVFL
jgi:hypothetical protein